MEIIIEDRNRNQTDGGSKVSRELSWCSFSPFNLCFLCMYWQVTVTVNMHMHSRPTEQISTAHRYTSETQKNHTRQSDGASGLVLNVWLHKNVKEKKKKKESTCFAELFKVLYYILWVGLFLPAKDDTVPVHHKHTLTHTNSNTLKKCEDLPSNKLHRLSLALVAGITCTTWRETERREACNVRSRHCGLAAAWLHTGCSLNKANCRKTTSWGWPPPCLIQSLNHCLNLNLNWMKRDE